MRQPTQHSRALTIALWLGLFFLSAFFIHWRLKSAYSATYSYFRWSDFGPLPDWVPLVLALRWPMRLVAALGGGLVAWAEWRGGALTGGLRRALADRRWAVLLLVIVGLASGSYYLLPGEPAFSTDAQAYIGYAELARQSLRQGQWPFWTNYGGMGMPFLQFYGPLYAVGVALTGLLIPNLFEATKLVQLGLHIASVVGMYAFVARVSGSRPAGFVAAWVYGFTFYRYHAILFNGILHLGAHLAIMPWLFYCIERLITDERKARAWAGLALLGGAAILAHPNYGVWVNILALLYGVLRIWTAYFGSRGVGWGLKSSPKPAEASSPYWWARLSMAAAGGTAAALVIGAFPVIGSFIEPRLVAIQWFQGARSFILGPLTFSQVFTFLGSFWSAEWFGGYVGISIVALAVAALGLAAWRRDWRGAALGLPFVFTLYLTLGPGHLPFDEIFQRLPLGWVVYVYSTPGRYLPYVTFFGAALVGLGAGWLVSAFDRLAGRLLPRSGAPELAALALVLIVSADVLPLSMQANSLRPASHPEGFKGAFAWLREHQPEMGGRALDPAANPNSLDLVQFAGVPAFGSVAHEMPAQSFMTLGAMQEAVMDSLEGGGLSPEAEGLLYLTNTAVLVTDEPILDDWAGQVLHTSGPVSVVASPATSAVVASGQIAVVAEDDDDLGGYLDEMGLDLENNSAEFLPVLADLPGDIPPAELPLSVTTVANEAQPQRASITYELSGPGYVQLAYSYYPYVHVRLDGELVPAVPSRFGLTVIQSPGGRHTVELVPYLSTWRVAVAVAGLAVGLGCLVLVWLNPARMGRRLTADPKPAA